MYPQAVRDAMEQLHGFETTPDGHRWPKPTMVKMAAGDAVLVMHACPHGGSHVEGPDPRMQCYFRITTQVIPHHETFSTAIQPPYSSTKG
jgi:hypothetical protein